MYNCYMYCRCTSMFPYMLYPLLICSERPESHFVRFLINRLIVWRLIFEFGVVFKGTNSGFVPVSVYPDNIFLFLTISAFSLPYGFSDRTSYCANHKSRLRPNHILVSETLPEDEFLEVTGTKDLRVFLVTSTSVRTLKIMPRNLNEKNSDSG
jgi:hypothetical protein